MSEQEPTPENANPTSSTRQVVGPIVLAIAFCFFFRIVHFGGTSAWLVFKSQPSLELPYVKVPVPETVQSIKTADEGARRKLEDDFVRTIKRACEGAGDVVIALQGDKDEVNSRGCQLTLLGLSAQLFSRQ